MDSCAEPQQQKGIAPVLANGCEPKNVDGVFLRKILKLRKIYLLTGDSPGREYFLMSYLLILENGASSLVV